VRAIQRAAHHHLFEHVHRIGQRLIEGDPHFGLRGRRHGNGPAGGLDLRRQQRRRQRGVRLSQGDHPLDLVRQLADVARP
jgi:hypothetical protein